MNVVFRTKSNKRQGSALKTTAFLVLAMSLWSNLLIGPEKLPGAVQLPAVSVHRSSRLTDRSDFIDIR